MGTRLRHGDAPWSLSFGVGPRTSQRQSEEASRSLKGFILTRPMRSSASRPPARRARPLSRWPWQAYRMELSHPPSIIVFEGSPGSLVSGGSQLNMDRTMSLGATGRPARLTTPDPDAGALRAPGRVTGEELGQLQKAARVALSNAYAPYSKFRVGAAVLTESGESHSGCNVENASYSLTICAERAAVFNAVSVEGAGVGLLAIAICSDSEIPSPPCGACRQVIAEFGPGALVTYSDGRSWIDTTCAELLPRSFTFDTNQ